MIDAVRVGVIGTGGMGARHAENLSSTVAGARVSAVMDVDGNRAATLANHCGGASVFSDANELIGSSQVDAVLIASPDATHAALALACLEARKPVLCEKPLAATTADAKKVLDAECALGTRFVQVGFMREFDPAHLEVKAVVNSAALGPPLLFRGVHINKNDNAQRSIADVITNTAVHDIHSARWITGQEVVQVYAQNIVASPGQPETCRMAIVHLRFSGGAIGVIEINADSGYGYEVDVEVTGSSGSVRSNSLRGPFVRHAGITSQAVEAEWLARFERAYVDEAQMWINSVRTEQPGGPSVWDGFVSMVIAQAAIRSITEGVPIVVELPARPAIYSTSA